MSLAKHFTGSRIIIALLVAAVLLIPTTAISLAQAAAGDAAEAPAETPAVAEESAADPEDTALFAELMTEGEALFARNCASCHGAEGNEELSSHVEILAGNSRAVGNASRMLRRIVHGGTYMPAIGAGMSDREVAAVATFVRNSWGNEHGLVIEEDVAGIR
jgi:mono/diheme cytochrome c family protein